MVKDLVQGGPIRGPQGQTPLNELLALWGLGRQGHRMGARASHWSPSWDTPLHSRPPPYREHVGPWGMGEPISDPHLFKATSVPCPATAPFWPPGPQSGTPPSFPTLTSGNSPPEVKPSSQDFLILFKRDVPADHVIEENPQRPHGGRPAVVAVVPDPFWGAVHSRTWSGHKDTRARSEANVHPWVRSGRSRDYYVTRTVESHQLTAHQGRRHRVVSAAAPAQDQN